jgi:hypothetical protein
MFRPAGRVTFVWTKVTKTVCPSFGPALRCAPLRVPSLRRCSTGPPRWAIHGLTGLSRHPCRETCCATPALGLLKGALGARRIICASAIGGLLASLLNPTYENHKILRTARTTSPVRRVSGIGVQGVEQHGCCERRKGPWTALVRRPTERRWRERTRNEAQRNAGPDVGCPSFAYFSWANKKSEAPYRAQPVVESSGTCLSLDRNNH